MWAKIIEAILPQVSKPGRYTGNEWNMVKKNHNDVAVSFALAFPDVYEVGMSHLGSKILYHELNRRDDTVAERVFAPWVDMEARMREEGIPLFSVETWTPVRDFDILGFTLQYELTFSNLVNMLDLAGIPLHVSCRTENDPLVIAGGPCAFNPEPLGDFLDAVVLGDGEEVIHEIIEIYKGWKDRNRPGGREGLLLQLVKVEGVYVPSFYDVDYGTDGAFKSIKPNRTGVPKTVSKRVVQDLDKLDYPTRPVVPYLDVVHDRAMVEVFRGCTRGCRFCHAGFIYRPVRERSPEKVIHLAREIIRNTGYDEISLTSLSSTDYSAIQDILKALSEEFAPQRISVSLPSLRVDAFSIGLAREVQKVRKTSLTFAPEAGTQRLRDVINKGVSEEDVLKTAEEAFTSGWSSLKFYFMIGLPTETDEDVRGIADLAYKVLGVASRLKVNRVRLTVSTSSFVPKAHTPFQWEPQLLPEELLRRQQLLAGLLRDRRLEYNWHDPQVSFLEAVFSRGDRRLGKALEAAWRHGARFDGWTDLFKKEAWDKAFEETGLDPSFYAHRRLHYGDPLPWDHLDTGVSKLYLEAEHQLALQGRATRDCRLGECSSCAVCWDLGVRVDLKPANFSLGGER